MSVPFTVQIKTAPHNNPSGSFVTAQGSDPHLITDTERSSFRIHDAQLKDAVRQYFRRAPNDAYLRSPTPWGDLYRTYGWPEVQVHTRVLSATVLSSNANIQALSTKVFKNNSSVPGVFNASLSQSVSDTTETNWSQANSVSVTQMVKYGIEIIGGETTFGYSYTWGQGGSKSNSVTIGDTVGVEVPLNPGQSVIASLTAWRGTLRVRVTYVATLSGYTAVNYNPTHEGHHFWALDINSVLYAANLPTSVTITSDVDVNFYSNGEVTLVDPPSGAVISTHKVPVRNTVSN